MTSGVTSLAGPGRTTSWIRVAYVRDLLRELIVRDIKLRYRGSVLGIAWTMLNPLAELLVLLFVFGVVLRIDIPNYGAYLFTGLLVYGWFQNSLNFATGAIVNNRELIRRPGVPAAILPIITVASHLVHFVLSLPILFGLLLMSSTPVTAAWLTLPALVAIEFVLILAFAYPIAAIHVWFRDTQHVLRVVLQLLFYLTPVFYQAATVPEPLRSAFRLNPMAQMIDAYRAVLLRGTLPSAMGIAGLIVFSTISLSIGLAAFNRSSYRFADEL